MECKLVHENLMALRDGEIADCLKKEILEHISGCKACSQEQKVIDSFFESYGKLEQLQLSEDYKSKLFNKCGISQGIKKDNRGSDFTLFRNKFSIAAAVIIIFFSYFIFSSEKESSYMELMKISKSVKESLKKASSLENIKLYGQCVNKINFKNNNFERVEFIVSKNENSNQYELIEIIEGKKEVLYARDDPFNIEFSMKGKSRLDYNIKLNIYKNRKNDDSIQLNSVLFLNNMNI